MAKLKIHCLQHVSYEGIGCIDYWSQVKGHTLTFTKLYETPVVFPSLDSFDWLIIMGGPLSVNDVENFPWLVEEKKFIESAIKKSKVVIGFCLGSQLISSALGAKVGPSAKKEIGWFDVSLTEEAKQHELFNGFADTFKTFHWHGDTFELPRHSKLLMSSAACKHQGFIYGKRTIALQFHPEVTQAGLKEMIANHSEELVVDEFVQTEEVILEQLNLVTDNHERMRIWLNKLQDVL